MAAVLIAATALLPEGANEGRGEPAGVAGAPDPCLDRARAATSSLWYYCRSFTFFVGSIFDPLKLTLTG